MKGKELYEVVLPLDVQKDVKRLSQLQQMPRNKKVDYAVSVMRDIVADKVLHALIEDDKRRS